MILPPDIAAELDAAFDALAPDIDEGMGTLQVWNDPPQLQLRRRSTTTEQFVDVHEPFTPVRIRLADRLERESGTNTGRVVITQGGEMWLRPPMQIQRDDRFTLEGVPCVVTLVEPEDRIKQVVQFRYLGGP